ncbi:MAG: hypothetical protein ACFE0I_07570 [Elainellaceae cyanobacterium]
MAYLSTGFRSLHLALVPLGMAGMSLVINLAQAASPPVEQDNFSSEMIASPAAQRLMEMFSPEIQAVLSACAENGGVDLDAGETEDGTIVCGDGTPSPEAQYSTYLSTVSNLLAASGLVGFRAVIDSNPQISPELISTYLSSSQGADILRSAVEMGIAQSQLLPGVAPESSVILVDEVISRMLPTLQSPSALSDLMGTPEQYNQVVSNFCTAPGMPIEQVTQLVTGLSALQLYSICIQESGIANQVRQMLDP